MFVSSVQNLRHAIHPAPIIFGWLLNLGKTYAPLARTVVTCRLLTKLFTGHEMAVLPHSVMSMTGFTVRHVALWNF